MAKILVVDDDKAICQFISLHLVDAGHEVTTCLDGAIAIRSILEQKPDLILLDLRMPYLDGFDMLKALKGDPLTREVPVIVVSSHSDLNSVGRVATLKANYFLSKPINGEKLIETVERVLAQRAV